MQSERKVILFVSMSLDGYLAGENDDLAWLSKMEVPGEDYGYGKFTADVDSYIVGRKTYDVIVEMSGDFPQAEKFDCYVLTRGHLPEKKGITFYNGDLKELISGLKKSRGKNIYCDGGAEVIKALMGDKLIDEFIISIVPIILGGGKRLFENGIPREDLLLFNSKTFKSGLVQLHFKKSN